MEFIINIWNNWTYYEKITSGILVFIVLLIIPLSVFLFSKNKNLLRISLISLGINGVLCLLALIILNGVFNISIEFVFKIVPFITLFVEVTSLGMMTGYYAQNHKHKDFPPITMKKEALKDTFSLTIALALLLTGFTILTPSILLILLLTLGLSLSVIWINYTLLYYIYK